MMIPAPVAEKLNEQIANEFHAALNYLAMACKLDAMGLKFLSQWFRRQGEEERQHGLKILDYLLEVQADVRLKAIAEPKGSFTSAEAIVQTALDQENGVTRQVHAIVDLATEHKDHATTAFMQWFVTEQVEEVSTMTDLLQVIKLAGPQHMLQAEAYIARMLQTTGS